MNRLRRYTRRRLEAQGYSGIPDELLMRIAPWLHVAPAFATAWVVAGMVFTSGTLLLVVVPVTAIAAAARSHPLDLIYEKGLRRLRDLPSLPPSPAPRRFSNWIDTLWILVLAVTYGVGMDLLGHILGGLFVGVWLVFALFGFCLPSWAYRYFFGPVSSYRLD